MEAVLTSRSIDVLQDLADQRLYLMRIATYDGDWLQVESVSKHIDPDDLEWYRYHPDSWIGDPDIDVDRLSQDLNNPHICNDVWSFVETLWEEKVSEHE